MTFETITSIVEPTHKVFLVEQKFLHSVVSIPTILSKNRVVFTENLIKSLCYVQIVIDTWKKDDRRGSILFFQDKQRPVVWHGVLTQHDLWRPGSRHLDRTFFQFTHGSYPLFREYLIFIRSQQWHLFQTERPMSF